MALQILEKQEVIFLNLISSSDYSLNNTQEINDLYLGQKSALINKSAYDVFQTNYDEFIHNTDTTNFNNAEDLESFIYQCSYFFFQIGVDLQQRIKCS